MKASRIPCLAAGAIAVAISWAGPGRQASASSPTTLVLSQDVAFNILGHWCGGIQEKSYATGFDQSTGFPTASVYMETRCGGSGRDGGGHTTTYSAYATAEWDFTGALISASVNPSAPITDSTYVATDSNGNQVYNNGSYAYLQLAPGWTPAPRLLSISAIYGSVAGGTAVNLTGTGFTGATSVHFGSVAAAFTVNGDTSIAATAPAQTAGTVPITVTTAGGSNAAGSKNEFTYYALPKISSLKPNHGPVTGGTVVTIAGSGFTNASSVLFDGVWAQFTVNSDTSITATAPAGENPDSAVVTVTTLGGTSPSTRGAQYTYDSVQPPTPKISRVSPSSGSIKGGTKVTIMGTNFSGATAVFFGKASARGFSVVSNSVIQAVSPRGSGSVDIRVVTPIGSSKSVHGDRFNFRK